ncbi:MAG TPA: AMMECR1 domain-containing protein [Vulgatibacter sp.]
MTGPTCTLDRLIEEANAALSRARPDAAAQTMGLFVTLRGPGGAVRGSVGTTEPALPVAELLPVLIREAAQRDPREPPIGPTESIELELWLLPEGPRPVSDPPRIDPEKDALRIRQGILSGTLLPDVAIAAGWDAETALAYACRKAGLPAGAWREPGVEVVAFRAERL